MNKDGLMGIICACGIGWYYVGPGTIEGIRSHVEQFMYRLQPHRTTAQIDKQLDMKKKEIQSPCSQERIPPPGCISETIEEVRFFYSSQRAQHDYHEALELILENLPPEPNQRTRQERIRYIQSLTSHAMFGIPDSDRIEDTHIIDENRAMNLKTYLLQKRTMNYF